MTRTLAPSGRTVHIPPYRPGTVIMVWAAATLPMAALAWLAAPWLADRLSGPGNVPMVKGMLIGPTTGPIWQFVLVAWLIWREQKTFSSPLVSEALWLHSPVNPRSGRAGGRQWLILIPLILLFAVEALIPGLPAPADRDLGAFLSSDIALDHALVVTLAVGLPIALGSLLTAGPRSGPPPGGPRRNSPSSVLPS